MAAIVLDNVAKRFGTVEVIRGLSLEIRSGEFLVLVGPSGCGKSTLLRMIAGLEDVSAGRILIDGRPVESLPPGARGVALVFQNYALYPHMSVRENMTFGLRNVGVPAPEANKLAEAAAERLRLLDLLDRKPGQLSGGQRQRVAIGRAIVKQPKAFLFDEPLSNLDAALRAGTRVELAKLHHALGSTMVFVTHDQVEAMTMATRIVVMNGGEIEQEGSPVDVYRRPRTRFVAQFIGSPAMNLIDVRPKGAAGAGTAVELPGGAVAEVAARLPPGSGRVHLGVRPENVRRAADGRLPASVDVVERLGPRTLVYARLPDGSTVAYEEGGESDAAVGARIRLEMDLDATHLIDEAGTVHSAARRAAP